MAFIGFWAFVLVATIVMVLTIGGSAQGTKIVVGTEATFPPYTFRTDKGELVGYDIEVVRNAAAMLGDEIEFKTILWDDLPEALASGEIDVIVSGMSITDERKKLYDFSVPYVSSGGYIITVKGSGLENRLMKDGKPVPGMWDRVSFGVLANTTHYDWAMANVPQANIIAFDSIENEYEALKSGRLAALFSDYLQGSEFMAMEGNADKYVFAGEEIIDNKTLGYGVGFAWRKGDPRRDAYDKKIKAMLKSGKLEEISLKYFEVGLSKSLGE
jgi:ABC-type amino acid transport substrate-binding protein